MADVRGSSPDDMLLAMPDAKSWASHVRHLRAPQRQLSVALPCCGISGSCGVFEAMGMDVKAVNIYDLEAAYEPLLRHRFPDATLHLGPTEGDILQVPLKDLELPVHLLLAGPPCPPWSANGQGGRQIREQPCLRGCCSGRSILQSPGRCWQP